MALRRVTRKGSLIVYILSMLMVMSALIVLIVEKAQKDLIDKASAVDTTSLRIAGYSALNATMAIIEEYREIDGGIYSTLQGWDEPFSEMRVSFPDGINVEVKVEDETGKYPLVAADADVLAAIFENMGLSSLESLKLADCLIDWMDTNDSAEIYGAEEGDYTETYSPKPPNRSLRDFSELRFVKNFDEYFFDEDGIENDYYNTFISLVSLEEFSTVNINEAPYLLLASLYDVAGYDFTDSTYSAIKGESGVSSTENAWLESLTDLQNRNAEAPSNYFVTESAMLKISITVTRGLAKFHLSAFYGEEPEDSTATVSSTRNGTTSTSSAGSSGSSYSTQTSDRNQNSNSAFGAGILRLSEFISTPY
ncbi:MAG: type II secretion system protein GspK [Opitutales bacterium]